MNQEDTGRTPSRRAVLAALGTAASAGCVRRVQSVVSRDAQEQVSLAIKTVPADADPVATQLARYLATRLQRVGIQAKVVPMSREELARDVLINQNFDIYVGQFPEQHDPDFLRPLLHSQFTAALGWQNPFGYGNLELDSALEAQVDQSASLRQATLDSVQRTVARDQPFSVVALPDAIRAVNPERITGWDDEKLHTVESYLSLEPAGEEETAEFRRGSTPNESEASTTATPEPTKLQMTLTDPRPTENLNPLAVEFRNHGTVTDLIYDSLGRWAGRTVKPWLASSWSWTTRDGAPVAQISLRENLSWHDGEPLTADDVEFTYAFLADTSLGKQDSPVPAPRHQGKLSLVDSVTARDETSLELQFVPSNVDVAKRALTVPVLPSHVWKQYSGPAGVAGLNADGSVTEALVRNNLQPVGSGPLVVTNVSLRESVRLEPFDEHFLETEVSGYAGRYAGGFGFDQLEFVVLPSSAAAVKLLLGGRADGTASPLHPSAVRDVGRSSDLELRIEQSRAFYHVGYNHRRPPLTNPRFRRAVARLLDKPFITDQLFDGYATPAASPLAGTPNVSPTLEWNGRDPELPFPGTNGSLDVARAKEAFRESGYRYTNDGKLVAQ